jgi:hypothetical protein
MEIVWGQLIAVFLMAVFGFLLGWVINGAFRPRAGQVRKEGAE